MPNDWDGNKFLGIEKQFQKFHSIEAVVRRCSSNEVFLKISPISHENTLLGVSF